MCVFVRVHRILQSNRREPSRLARSGPELSAQASIDNAPVLHLIGALKLPPPEIRARREHRIKVLITSQREPIPELALVQDTEVVNVPGGGQAGEKIGAAIVHLAE